MPGPLVFVGIGEVLFDVFEDGKEALGGAPLNVAVHAHQLAAPPGLGEGIVVSRAGSDPQGERLLRSLGARGMSTAHVDVDSRHRTGRVTVFMRDGEPGYQIETDSAWDHIAAHESLDALAAQCDAVCFGSLAQRSPVSRNTIRRFLENASGAIRLYDVNLRRNTLTGEEGFSAEIVETSCELATIVKANAAELIAICRLLRLSSSIDESENGIRRGLEALLNRFPVRAVVLTRDARGTLAFTRQGEFTAQVALVPPARLHPVGAGDACSAGILFGLVRGWDMSRAVDLANRMGSWVASQPPATPPLPDSILDFVRREAS